MKGSECRLIEFMNGSLKRFVIPVYQRNYDWETIHCKQLYDDIIKVIKKNKRSHFFGSIVSVNEADGRYTKLLIVDGQQRLTTVSLLFLAMCNLMKAGIITPKQDTLQREIYENYLVDQYRPDETRIKLKPVKNDQIAFGKFFKDDASDYIKDSNLTVNYEYFYDRLQQLELEGINDIDEFYDAVCRLEIIAISLDKYDNAQLIFESLNATGLNLQEGDKIRNYMLMDLPEDEQTAYYENYWNKIEKDTNYDVSSFIRDYLSVKQRAIPSQKKVYIKFKEYMEGSERSKKDILDELVAYAKRYKILLEGGTDNQDLNDCIYRLNRLETSIIRPFFLEVLRLHDERILNLNDVKEIAQITESYLFRRLICDLQGNVLNKIFLFLHNEIVRYDNGATENYIEKFKYALLSKRDRGRFPDDQEFIPAFSEKSVYRMPSKNTIYILERLENFRTGAEGKRVYDLCDKGTYSVEHIMPQHLTPIWQKELGDDYAQIHDKWLHRIANLTLTAYNSSYSNKPFDVKKNCGEHGFERSGIKLNVYIAQFEKWNSESLEKRDSHLRKEAQEIWQLPVTDYQPAAKVFDSCTLEDDLNLTGRKIAGFAFKNSEHPTDTWIEMFQQVIQILYEDHRSIIKHLAVSQKGFLASQFVTSTDDYVKFKEIGDGIYVSGHNSTRTKIAMLNELFGLCDESTADLVFYLQNEEEIDDE